MISEGYFERFFASIFVRHAIFKLPKRFSTWLGKHIWIVATTPPDKLNPSMYNR